MWPKYKSRAPSKIGVYSDLPLTEGVPTKGSTSEKVPRAENAKPKGTCELNWSFLSASSDERPKQEPTPEEKEDWSGANERCDPRDQEKKVECEISLSMVSLSSLLESKRESQDEKNQNEWA